MSEVVIIGGGYFQAAPTEAEAKRKFSNRGGKLSRGYMVVTFAQEGQFAGVRWDGGVEYTGTAEPTVRVVNPRAVSKR